MEVGCEVVIKATKVDYVYDSDPEKNPNAKPFKNLTYLDVLSKGLKVMDSTAITLCMDNRIPIVVFDLMGEGLIERIVGGEAIGTTVACCMRTDCLMSRRMNFCACAGLRMPPPAVRSASARSA